MAAAKQGMQNKRKIMFGSGRWQFQMMTKLFSKKYCCMVFAQDFETFEQV
jgi:hypothetical protein